MAHQRSVARIINPERRLSKTPTVLIDSERFVESRIAPACGGWLHLPASLPSVEEQCSCQLGRIIWIRFLNRPCVFAKWTTEVQSDCARFSFQIVGLPDPIALGAAIRRRRWFHGRRIMEYLIRAVKATGLPLCPLHDIFSWDASSGSIGGRVKILRSEGFANSPRSLMLRRKKLRLFPKSLQRSSSTPDSQACPNVSGFLERKITANRSHAFIA